MSPFLFNTSSPQTTPGVTTSGPPPPLSDRNRGPEIMLQTWSECAIAALAILVRLISRAIVGRYGWDDWFMIATWLCFGVSSVMATMVSNIGGCSHLRDLSVDRIALVLHYDWIATSLGVGALTLGKISNALLVLRIIGPQNIWPKWIILVGIAFTVLTFVASTLVNFAQCRPTKAIWDTTMHRRCWDSRKITDVNIMIAAWDAFFDVVLVIVLNTIIWRLNMKKARKIALSLVLSSGVVSAVICADGRAYTMRKLNAHQDFAWQTMDLYAWTTAETLAVILFGSGPVFKPAFVRFVWEAKCFGLNRRSPHRDSGRRSDQVHGPSREARRNIPNPLDISIGEAPTESS